MPPSAFRGAPGAGAARFRRQQVFSLWEHPFPTISDQRQFRLRDDFRIGQLPICGVDLPAAPRAACPFLGQGMQCRRSPPSLPPVPCVRGQGPDGGAGRRGLVRLGEPPSTCLAPPVPASPPSSTLPHGRLRGTADRPNAKSLSRCSRLIEK